MRILGNRYTDAYVGDDGRWHHTAGGRQVVVQLTHDDLADLAGALEAAGDAFAAAEDAGDHEGQERHGDRIAAIMRLLGDDKTDFNGIKRREATKREFAGTRVPGSVFVACGTVTAIVCAEDGDWWFVHRQMWRRRDERGTCLGRVNGRDVDPS